MDPVKNPYAPGAGTPPPELAGRDDLLNSVSVALQRVRAGRPAKSVLMIGLRGVGKTVLLERMRSDAAADGFATFRVEAPEGRSLPAMLAPELRRALLSVSKKEKSKELARKGLRALAGFAGAMKIKYQDIEVGVDVEAEPGLADNADLEHDLQVLLELVGQAHQAVDSALAMFVDELQYVEEDQLAALIVALHRLSQLSLPVVLVGAGLPQLRGQTGSAKSYAERLFEFPEVGALSHEDAEAAIVNPARELGVEYQSGAVDLILEKTKGYPYFLQEWGSHAWKVADASPITTQDVDDASDLAVAALDESFFRVRFDRLTPSEKRYLRAMAELGPGPHRSGDIAHVLGRKVTSLAPVRSKLIRKGMVWSPSHGDTGFTVPLFDEFMKRIMPGGSWED